jgi:hypothetical protein
MKLRGDHPAVIEHPEWWTDANEDPDMAALAQVLSGQPPPSAALAPAVVSASPSANVPGGHSWEKIEETYRRLAAEKPAPKWSRQRADRPSRPEVAKALDVSPATLIRACKYHGKGSRWPPAGL